MPRPVPRSAGMDAGNEGRGPCSREAQSIYLGRQELHRQTCEQSMQSKPCGLVAENIAQAVSLKLNTPAMGWAWETGEGFLEEEGKEDK